MQLNALQSKTARTRSRRVGRGGKRGKTSGRGGKGQTARSGSSLRPEWREIIKRLPKRRGYGKHRARSVVPTRVRPFGVNLDTIAAHFEAGEVVSPAVLVKKGMARETKGYLPIIKVLGSSVDKKLKFEKCVFTASARAAVEKAGGSIA